MIFAVSTIFATDLFRVVHIVLIRQIATGATQESDDEVIGGLTAGQMGQAVEHGADQADLDDVTGLKWTD